MPRADRMERLGRVFLASIAHLALVAVLAPGLVCSMLMALESHEPPFWAVAFYGAVFGAIYAYPVCAPLAVVTCAVYASLSRIRIAPIWAQAPAWCLIGGLSASAFWMMPGESGTQMFLLMFGFGGLAGIVIGVLVWAIWRLVDIPPHMVIAD